MQKDGKYLSRLKSSLIDGFLIIGITSALILFCEAFLRFFYPQNLVGSRITGETFSNSDEIFGVRFTPGARWRFAHPEYNVEYEINKQGFRDKKKHLVPKPKDTLRVLLIGDSFTFGLGVDYDQIWPVIVEKRFIKSGNNSIDLVKAGIIGMDTRSEFFLIKDILEKYDSDFVVVGFLINDLYTNTLFGITEKINSDGNNEADARALDIENESENSWIKTKKQIFIRNDRISNFHLLTLAKRLAIESEYLYCKLYLHSARGEYLTFPLAAGPLEKLRITEVLLKEIARYCHSLGKKLIVVSIPQQFQVLYSKLLINHPNIDVSFYDNYFFNIAKQNNFIWITTLDEFVKSKSGEKLFYRLDGHLTSEGNKIVADVFVEKIFPYLIDFEYGSFIH